MPRRTLYIILIQVLEYVKILNINRKGGGKMGNMRKGIIARVPFSMNIDVDLWQRFLDCVYARGITRVGAIRESLRLWLEVNEDKVA